MQGGGEMFIRALCRILHLSIGAFFLHISMSLSPKNVRIIPRHPLQRSSAAIDPILPHLLRWAGPRPSPTATWASFFLSPETGTIVLAFFLSFFTFSRRPTQIPLRPDTTVTRSGAVTKCCQINEALPIDSLDPLPPCDRPEISLLCELATKNKPLTPLLSPILPF